jgi:4-alpha-glucanotransferase
MAQAPLYDWFNERASGVLLHPTSLPSRTGIGNFGKAAYQFIDLLAESGFTVWQLCPLGPTGYGDSPYQCFSAFAGNPYLIDLEAVQNEGLLTTGALDGLEALPSNFCDYGKLYHEFWPVLKKAYLSFCTLEDQSFANYGSFEEFKKTNAKWLTNFSLFMGLKEAFDGQCWLDWPDAFKNFKTAKLEELPNSVKEAADLHAFAQYLFAGQYKRFRAYAAQKGVRVMGDLPIFVALDSADVWANRECFQLHTDGSPEAVAGVPPDYFAVDGQLWGNPLYAWKAHEANGFKWWLERIESNLALYDYIRLDHFRGFESYWSVAGDAKTAREGKWELAPGEAFFKAVAKKFPEARIIAEDLGIITPEVKNLMTTTGLPGMTVLQFAFGGAADNAYLPHNVCSNSVIYTGTHDNDTSLGWYKGTTPEVRDHIRRYYRISGENIAWDLIRSALSSNAKLAIIPLQDLMSLGSEARLNTPGVAAGNWQWRTSHEAMTDLKNESSAYLKGINALYGRIVD